MKSLSAVCLIFLLAAPVYSQTGSINNTLGSGGTFTVKNSANNPLVVVDEATGQLTADRVKVEGVPSFHVTHNVEATAGTSPSVLADWDETAYTGSHDNSDSFDPGTGEFTAPRSGFYFLSAYIGVGGAGSSGLTLVMRIGGNITGLQAYVPTNGGAGFVGVSGVLKLTGGTVVTVAIYKPDGQSNCAANDGYFSGYLISDF